MQSDDKVAAHRALKRLRALTGQGTAFPTAAEISGNVRSSLESQRAASGRLQPSEAGSSSSLGSVRRSQNPNPTVSTNPPPQSDGDSSGQGRPSAGGQLGGPAPSAATAAALRWMTAAGLNDASLAARGASPTSSWGRSITRGPEKHRALFEAFEGMRNDGCAEPDADAAADADAGSGWGTPSRSGLGPRPRSGSLSARGVPPEDTAGAGLNRRLERIATGVPLAGSVQSWPRRMAHGVEERPSIFGAFPEVSAHLGRLDAAAAASGASGDAGRLNPAGSSQGPPTLPAGPLPSATQSWARGVMHGAERRRSVVDVFGRAGGKGSGSGSGADAPGPLPSSTQSWSKGVMHGAERRPSVLDMFGAAGGERSGSGSGVGSGSKAEVSAGGRAPLHRTAVSGELPEMATLPLPAIGQPPQEPLLASTRTWARPATAARPPLRPLMTAGSSSGSLSRLAVADAQAAAQKSNPDIEAPQDPSPGAPPSGASRADIEMGAVSGSSTAILEGAPPPPPPPPMAEPVLLTSKSAPGAVGASTGAAPAAALPAAQGHGAGGGAGQVAHSNPDNEGSGSSAATPAAQETVAGAVQATKLPPVTESRPRGAAGLTTDSNPYQGSGSDAGHEGLSGMPAPAQLAVQANKPSHVTNQGATRKPCHGSAVGTAAGAELETPAQLAAAAEPRSVGDSRPGVQESSSGTAPAAELETPTGVALATVPRLLAKSQASARLGSERRPSLFDVFPEIRAAGGVERGAEPLHGAEALGRQGSETARGEADPPARTAAPTSAGALPGSGSLQTLTLTAGEQAHSPLGAGASVPRDGAQGEQSEIARNGADVSSVGRAAETAGRASDQGRPEPAGRRSEQGLLVPSAGDKRPLGAKLFAGGAPESEETWAAGDTRTHTLAQVLLPHAHPGPCPATVSSCW